MIVLEPGDRAALELWLCYLEDIANGLQGAQGVVGYLDGGQLVGMQDGPDILDDVTEEALDAEEAIGLDGEAEDWYDDGDPYWPRG